MARLRGSGCGPDLQELPVVGKVQKSRKQLKSEAVMCAVKFSTM